MSSTRDSQLAQKPKTAKQATPDRSRTQPRPGSPAQLLQLQRQYGNRAVQRTIQREAARERADAQQLLGQPTIQRVGINDQ